MNVKSTFVQPTHAASERIQQILAEAGADGNQKVQLFVFDTLAGEKSVVTGITVGKVSGQSIDGVKVSAIGNAVLECMTAHHELNYPGKPLVIAGVAQAAGAADRVRKVLKQVSPGAAVLFVCADSKIYDAASPGLNVDYSSAKQGPH